MGVPTRWRSTTVVKALALCVLVAGCAQQPIAAERVSPSPAPSRAAACSPAPLVTPSEERTPGWESGEQEPLRSDRDAIARYGAEHHGEFAGIWLENEPWIRLVAAFTGNLEAHCAALREIVDHPERLEVVRGDHTVEELERIHAEIMAEMTPDGQIQGLGVAHDHVEVELRADGERLAAELRERYGDAVRLRVGTAPYPPSDPPEPVIACDIGEIAEWPPGVSASLDLDDDAIAPGENTTGTVTIANDTADRFTVLLGATEVGYVFEEGGTTPVGAYTGGLTGEGRNVNLAPGDRATLDVVVGTAACDPSRGYALPPGTYDVRAGLSEAAPDERPTWLSEPARLRLVDS